MAKRFTDTEKWKKSFLKSMPAVYKLLWLYICDDCDHAGIWHVDMDIASIRVGEKISLQDSLAALNGKVIPFDGGEKWFIPSFIEFQYGELNEKNRVHDSILKILNKYKLSPYISPLQGAMDKDKDKDKDLDKKEEPKIEKKPPVQILAGLWMEANPNYQFHQTFDYTALREIFEFLLGGELSEIPEFELTEMMGRFIQTVKQHKFYKDKPLRQMVSGIQGIKSAMFTKVDKMVY